MAPKFPRNVNPFNRHGRGRPAALFYGVEPLESRVLLSGSSLQSLALFGTNDTGTFIASGLAVDPAGDVFGTAQTGGAYGLGTVFEVLHGQSTMTPIASFDGTNGASPSGNVVLDSAGNLYGITAFGGAPAAGGVQNGAVFEVVHGTHTIKPLASIPYPSWSSTLAVDQQGNVFGETGGSLFEIPKGASTATILSTAGNFVGQLFLDPDDNIFGTTINFDDTETLFELVHGSPTLTTLFHFDSTTVPYPMGVFADSAGNLYGTVTNAANDQTTSYSIFRIAKDGSGFTTLATIDVDDSSDLVPAISAVDGSGNLYGITYDYASGIPIVGSIIELSHGSSAFSTLATFPPNINAQTLLSLDAAGNIYGVASGVFELPRGSSSIITLANTDGDNGRIFPLPSGSLTSDGKGDLFGVAPFGGDNLDGTAFEVAAGSSAITTIAAFDGADGEIPWGQLAMDSRGDLFGATYAGGAYDRGTIFEIARGSKSIITLASFSSNDGASPRSGVLIDGEGNLFGTTLLGGANNLGTVFELPAGSHSITILASFDFGSGGWPIGQIAMDAGGNIYGLTERGGRSNVGVVFRYDPATSSIVPLASFNSSLNNGHPLDQDLELGGIAVDGKGDVFGTAAYAGPYGDGLYHDGAVFEIPIGGNTLNPLAFFDGTNGLRPQGLLWLDGDGDLFGTTAYGGTSAIWGGQGVVYELAAGSSAITPVASFDPGTGSMPMDVLFDPNGRGYGITGSGGGYVPATLDGNNMPLELEGFGNVFELSPIPFSNAITGTSAVDNITLVQDSDHHNIDWTLNGGQPFLLPINDPAGLTINGDGGNDVITLDYSNGNPLPATLHLNGTFTINGLQGSNPLAGRTLEIGSSTVYLTYANSRSDPLALVRGYLRDGLGDGSWDGTPGTLTGVITSDVAADDPSQSTGIGYLDLTHWQPGGKHGKPLSAIELKATPYGDTNLDGTVDFHDFLSLIQNYGANRGGTWDDGDFNYDGRVDALDLELLSRNYLISGHRPGRRWF